jgi:hypothetical protein
MALEQVVECPVALAKLRSAPLGTLLEGFCKWLLECGFQRVSLRSHLSILSRLNEYLRRPKTRMRQTLTAEDIKRFLEACAVGWDNHGPLDLRRVRPSVNRFVEYLRQAGRLAGRRHVPRRGRVRRGARQAHALPAVAARRVPPGPDDPGRHAGRSAPRARRQAVCHSAPCSTLCAGAP